MQAKSAQLDQFWTMAKADPSTTLPQLRRELDTASNSAFFFYDGAKLLLTLSTDRSDQAIALRAIAKADLRGIQPTDYVSTVHQLAGAGLDAREAAFQILPFPDLKVFFPQHSLTLGQDFALICMLFPMEEKLFVPDLIERLGREADVDTQKSLLVALWYAVTPAADAALQSFADNPHNNPDAVALTKTLLDRAKTIGSPSSTPIEALREDRRKVMQRPISDEALIEFDELTSKIRGGS
ncbi:MULTISPECIES: hypothetical protein [unclassified Bradyrhizobium]|uniref:hypothetical protein n=1 Tax=unclassified Bradyrhizobium TaxID=2631580 RepID=UPI0024E0BA1F|nr:MULTISPECIES: hypothetical protein [unclassified Bradyrhizobium]